MKLVIESTKTNAGTRKLPMTEDVFRCFQVIIEDREKPRFEKMMDGYTGFLFLDKDNLPLVAMHWERRFNHMVKRLLHGRAFFLHSLLPKSSGLW